MAQVQVENEKRKQQSRLQLPLEENLFQSLSETQVQPMEKTLKLAQSSVKKRMPKTRKRKVNLTNDFVPCAVPIPSDSSPSSNDLNNSLYYSNNNSEIVSSLLFFNVFLDLSLIPFLETYFVNSQSSNNHIDYLTRFRIALFKHRVMSSLFVELSQTPSANSSESLYSLFLRISESQGITFTS